jgi:hypothetical protein
VGVGSGSRKEKEIGSGVWAGGGGRSVGVGGGGGGGGSFVVSPLLAMCVEESKGAGCIVFSYEVIGDAITFCYIYVCLPCMQDVHPFRKSPQTLETPDKWMSFAFALLGRKALCCLCPGC